MDPQDAPKQGELEHAPQKMDSSPQLDAVKRLTRGYYGLLALASAVVLIVIASLGAMQYLSERSAALQEIDVRLVRGSVALEQPLRQLSTQAARLGQWAGDYIAAYEYHQRIPRLRTILERYAKEDSFDLDRLEPPFSRRDTGNLIGLGALDSRDRALNRELDMALELFRLQSLVGEMTIGASRTYYLSARQFISVFPWMSKAALIEHAESNERLFFKQLYRSPAWQSAQPAVNPEKEPRWTGPHPDITGQKLVATYSVPIYEGDRLLGMVAGEVAVGYIARLVQSMDVGPGTLVLAAADGAVFASRGEDREGAQTAHIRDLLPEPARKRLVDLPSHYRDPGLKELGIFVRKLDAAPWFLVYVQPETAMAAKVLPRFAPFLLIALFLTAFLVIAQVYMTRRFVKPALSMAEYVEAETTHGGAHVPEVPSAWEPWLRSVAAALRLKDVERHLRSFMESAKGFVVYQLGADALHPGRSRVLFVSPSIKDIMGVADPYRFEAWFANIDAQDRDRVLEAARSAFANAQPFDETFKLFHTDRNEHAWIHAAATPVFDADGKLAYYNGLIIDITQRKRAEEDLHRELTKFRVLYQVATAMTAERTLEDNLILIVNKARQLLSSDSAYVALRDEQAGAIVMRACSGINTDAFKHLLIPFGAGLGGRVAQLGKGVIVENYFRETGPLLHDIVRAEGLISGVAAPIQIGTKNLGVLYAFNRAPTRFTQEDLNTLTLLANLAALEISRKTFEAELQAARDDLEAKVEYRTAQLLEANRRLTREITERVEAQKALEASEQTLRTIFNISRDPIFIHDGEGKIVDVNDRMLQVYEVTREQALSLSLEYDFSSDENPIAILRALWAETLRGKNQFFEWKARRPNDGTVFDVEVFLTKLTTREGDLILANVHDVTERKRSEEELKFQQAYSEMLFEQSPDAIAVVDMDNRVERVNEAFTALFGYSKDEVHGKSLDELVVPVDRREEAYGVSTAA
ncbi:MAG: PAS domain S-box protein, partial [Desulfomonilaceae bacterium]